MLGLEHSQLIAIYPSIGLLINSAMHTYYVGDERTTKRFGLPYKESLGQELGVLYGYLGAVALAVITFSIVGLVEFERVVDSASYRVIAMNLASLLFIGSIVVHISQIIAGSSWTKLGLDTAVFLMTAFAIILYQNPGGITVWNVFPTYLTLVFGLFTIGSKWVDYKTRDPTVETNLEYTTSVSGSSLEFDRTLPGEAGDSERGSGPFPPFVSLAYYVVASGYIIIGSLISTVLIGLFVQ